MLNNNWLTFANISHLSEKLSGDILTIAKKSIDLNGKFTIVLAGGTSVVDTYKILSKSKSDWSRWHVYMSDERSLPLQDKDRNDTVINEVWLNNGLIPKQNINFIHAEQGNKEAADNYESILKNVGDFDLVLLGLGEDGHTASLFPKHKYNEDRDVVIEENSPKYPKNRISISYSRLNKSKYVFKVIVGESKKMAVRLMIEGCNIPINKIHGKNERFFLTSCSIEGE
jgi:6-phosphogluconolactonase